MTGLTASSFTATSGNWTGFTLAWSGGTGTGVSYTYYVNNVQVYPSGTAGNVVFTGLPTPSSSTTPTAYAWYVDVCANNLAGTTHGISTVYAPPTAISSVTLSNAGIGVFDVTWVGGLGNSVTYLYDVSSSGAIVASGSYTTTALGSVNPTRFTMTDNSAKTYTAVVKAANAGGTVSSATSGSITTLAPYTVRINSITTSSGSYTGDRKSVASNNLQSGDGLVLGTSTYSGTNYNVFAFGQTAFTYTLNYTCATATTVQVLAVGGGGAGGAQNAGGGGGAGGVVMTTVNLLANTTNTIIVTIGIGGLTTRATGSTTTAVFTGVSTVTAGGGGGGGDDTTFNGGNGSSNGGSGGGGNGVGSGNPGTGGLKNTSNGNLANDGYTGALGYNAGGGGGAGAAATSVNGGNGIQCSTLYGIANCTPTGYLKLSNYYWGGGGGGAQSGSLGGKGGGGGKTGYSGLADTNGIATGSINTSGNGSANGGPNTGGGGGAPWYQGVAGTGGSGIVILAFPV